MNITRYEELHPQQQVLPNDVIEKAIRLHQILNKQLPLSNVARATGMIFFYRFYEHEQNIFPKEFALYAISCLHLATKVCEAAIPLTTFSSAIYKASGDLRSQYQEVFETLDGMPTFSSEGFIVELNEKLVNREMRAIVALGFNFDVIQPYDLLGYYIDKILKWHLKKDSEFFYPLKKELIQNCSLFLNDLQLTSMFYIYEPELLAIAAINMTFNWLKLPLVSPAKNPWYSFLASNLVSATVEKVEKVIDAVYNFFMSQFKINKKQPFTERKTKVPDSVLEQWINYPYMPLKDAPLCPPPPIRMADKLVENSESFKKCELDHLPPYPPPTYLMGETDSSKRSINLNLQQLQSEFQLINPKKNLKGDERKSKKRKNNPSPSNARRNQRQHNDHIRGRPNEFPPHRGNLPHHRHEGRRSMQEYDSEYDYDGYFHLSPQYPNPPGAQSDRRATRWIPSREGGNAGKNWSPPSRGRQRDDDYFGHYSRDMFDDIEFRRGPNFNQPLPPSPKGRGREMNGRPFLPPPASERERGRDQDRDIDKERERFQERGRGRDIPSKVREKDFFDDPRFFRGPTLQPPPPGRGYRESDRDRDRKNDRSMMRDESERDRSRQGDKDRDKKNDKDRKNDRNKTHDEENRERNMKNNRDGNRDRTKEKESDRGRDKNSFNEKNKTNNNPNANIKSDSKDTSSPNNSKKDQS